jgi:hypothetical protein
MYIPAVEGDTRSTADLLEAWREATRASELAERLAVLASEAAEQADKNSAVAQEIALLAEQAATAAERAAARSRLAAEQAAEIAAKSREQRVREADETVTAAAALEGEARELYHKAERQAREHHESN